ncbi:glycosyltransferase family 4 protein [Flavobacterium xinjiangense]|uniref:Glycosyltransferase involved in cell wall bisynthesis n=1 Tax=Flavobacterium xinjiangense TaxID=178356 RepID=A0A1M7MRA1_9FLAO|nr:glycosyltransferase family 4 protein [Flavobacterium xinjiangense]SHM93494.1 Glycosyltransferase involved in cell wall bisynthesis [Flavobacterium xinjiangense]
MKIFFMVPLVTHYRETFFQKLISMHPEHEWLIIDGEKKVDDGRPNYNKKFDFPHKRFVETIKKVGPFSLRNYPGLLEFIKIEKPEMILLPGIVGTKAYRDLAHLARNKTFKLVMWSCLWEHPDVKSSWLNGFKKNISKKYFNSASYQITYSSYAKKRLIEYGFPEEKVAIAFNGIELDGLEALRMDQLKFSELKRKLNIEEGKNIFLCVGGLGADKNVLLLLKAILLLKKQNLTQSFILLIIGDGPEAKRLNDFVFENTLYDEVKFLGRIVDGIDDYFQCSDCLILPGAGGLSLNQAMYWEKPCIVSHADGTEDDLIIDDVTGFRFDNDNVISLSEAILRFLNSSLDDLKLMGEKGNALIRSQSNVDQMVKTFGKVITFIR